MQQLSYINDEKHITRMGDANTVKAMFPRSMEDIMTTQASCDAESIPRLLYTACPWNDICLR